MSNLDERREKGCADRRCLEPVGSPPGRNPLAGRNWEGFATDPYLTGVAMEETITGIQSTGVQVSRSLGLLCLRCALVNRVLST